MAPTQFTKVPLHRPEFGELVIVDFDELLGALKLRKRLDLLVGEAGDDEAVALKHQAFHGERDALFAEPQETAVVNDDI